MREMAARYWRRLLYLCLRLRFALQDILIGEGCRISSRSVVRCVDGGRIIIGPNTVVHEFAMLMTYRGNITIGADCSVNHFSILYGQGGLSIGNGVRIAAHTVIVPSNHRFDRADVPIYTQGHEQLGVVIEDDVWIGTNCTILDGVTIGRGSVIGAGSVVAHSLPPMSVAVGVPARVIKQRGLMPAGVDLVGSEN